jgi:hypothetical protein
MIQIADPQFIKAQKDRMSHLQQQLETIVTEMKTIQEFLDGYEVRTNA